MKHVSAIAAMLLICAAGFGQSVLVMPGLTVVSRDGELPTEFGVHLKRVDFGSKSVLGLKSFEVRGSYDLEDQSLRAEITYPLVFGFLAPGVTARYRDGAIIPGATVEMDFFYFPFAFASILAFENPVVIPSVYVAANLEPVGWGIATGVRISAPLWEKRGQQ